MIKELEGFEEIPKAEIHIDIIYIDTGSRYSHVPEWMIKRKITLIQKDPLKRTNNGPITCLPMMWTILTAHIRKEIYYLFTSRGFFHEKQKEYCKGSRGTGELLYIDAT